MDFTSLVSELEKAVVSSSSPILNEQRKLKLLLVSTHLDQTTGYAKVTHGILHELAKCPWIAVTHFAIQSVNKKIANRVYPQNIKVINAIELNTDPEHGGFGFTELPNVIMKEKPDIVCIYNDLAVIAEYISAIRKLGGSRTYKIWAYIDQVYPVNNPILIDMVNRDIDRIFCFTKEWKIVLKDQMVTRPIDIMTHAFDNKIFHPIPRDSARQTMKIPKESFIFLNMNRNQPRKRHDILIMAFVELIIRHPMKPIFLMCICDKGERGGFSIFDIYARELQLHGVSVDQFGNRLMVSSSDMCYSDEDVNIFYNVADCGVSCADGEGFGLCAFEQMGCGVPQILSDVIGHREYSTDRNSILVKPVIRAYLANAFYPTGGEVHIVNYHDFANAMERYVIDDNLRKIHGNAARETVLSYTWNKSCKTFIKRLQNAYSEIIEGSDEDEE